MWSDADRAEARQSPTHLSRAPPSSEKRGEEISSLVERRTRTLTARLSGRYDMTAKEWDNIPEPRGRKPLRTRAQVSSRIVSSTRSLRVQALCKSTTKHEGPARRGNGIHERTRTPTDLVVSRYITLAAHRSCSSSSPQDVDSAITRSIKKMINEGVEPATLALLAPRSNQLS
jgi:hypothetical protein